MKSNETVDADIFLKLFSDTAYDCFFVLCMYICFARRLVFRRPSASRRSGGAVCHLPFV